MWLWQNTWVAYAINKPFMWLWQNTWVAYAINKPFMWLWTEHMGNHAINKAFMWLRQNIWVTYAIITHIMLWQNTRVAHTLMKPFKWFWKKRKIAHLHYHQIRNQFHYNSQLYSPSLYLTSRICGNLLRYWSNVSSTNLPQKDQCSRQNPNGPEQW